MSDFYGFLKSYATLLSAAFGGILLTLISQLSGIAPPFPGVVQITATYQILILIIVYQMFYRKKRAAASAAIITSAIMFVVLTVIYLLSFYSLTFIDTDGAREFKGLRCTAEAASRFAGECPLLSQKAIELAGNIRSDLWTDFGLAAAGTLVLSLWLAFFASVCFAIAVFVNFSRQKA
jgi:hypothetical protein